MGIISGGKIIEGAGLGAPLQNAGAPSAGTNEVQTAALGGTGLGSTFKLILDGVKTAAIAWSATNATLLSNINTALDAAFGASMIVATDSTLTAGIGNLLLTFSGSDVSKKAVNAMTAEIVSGSLTISIAETTAGVDATARGIAAGGQLIDTTNKKIYINTGTPNAPTWTVVGAQS
jgi:hypothetical protein